MPKLYVRLFSGATVSKRPTIEIWMPLHFADLTKSCARMSELEECVFLRLLRDAWLNGPATDSDKTLSKIARISRAKWNKIRAVLEPNFDLSNGFWIHAPTEERRQHSLRVSATKQAAVNSRYDRQNADGTGSTYEDIRDLSSSSDRLVLPYPSQELASDYQDRATGEVICLQTTLAEKLAKEADQGRSGRVVADDPTNAACEKKTGLGVASNA